MKSGQRNGVVLILLGLALPIVALSFAKMPVYLFDDPRFPPRVLDWIQQSKIRLVQGKEADETTCRQSLSGQDEMDRVFREKEITDRRDFVGRSLSEAEVESAKQKLAELRRKNEACWERYWRDPRPVRSVDLPYRYVFAGGVITLFIGIGMVILGRTRPGNESIS